MDRFRGKVAVVTGASSGIGAKIAASLVEEGLQAVGIARRSERIKDLASTLSSCGKLHAYQADLKNEEEVIQAFKWVTKNLGPVHILINNAAISKHSSLMNGDTKIWKDILDTNILALCVATREAIQIMSEHQIQGHIIHINSIVGQSNLYFNGINVYGASKHAVSNLTEILRKEMIDAGSRIKITSISPGTVETELLAELVGEKLQNLPRLQTKDVADAVLYALGTPSHVQVHEITIKPVGEAK